MNNRPKKQEELEDILLSIKRYLAVNHQNVTFIYSFITHKLDEENACMDCGEPCEVVDYDKSTLGAFGYLENLREGVEIIRDMVEDEINEEGFVNVME